MSAPETGRLRLRADRDVCIGAGLCVLTSGELFDQDDEGVVVLLEPEPVPENEPVVRQAVHACPSGALLLDER